MVNFTIRFLGTRGGEVSHESGCDCSASELPGMIADGEASNPGLLRSCEDTDLKVCSDECADAWGILTPVVSECELRD